MYLRACGICRFCGQCRGGGGWIGFAAVITARRYSPAHIVVIDMTESRLPAAKMLGADTTVLASADGPLAAVRP